MCFGVSENVNYATNFILITSNLITSNYYICSQCSNNEGILDYCQNQKVNVYLASIQKHCQSVKGGSLLVPAGPANV